MKGSQFVALLAAASLLAACQGQPYGGAFGNSTPGSSGINKQTVGTLGGAAGGAIIGSNIGKGKGNIAAIAIGTLLGAGLGSSIGGSLDRADQAYYGNSAQQAFEYTPTGQTESWRNPDSGHSGAVTPTRTFQNQNGNYCREFSHNINVGGKTEKGYGTACRQPDGTWKIIDQ